MKIGLRTAIVAPITAYTEGSAITYGTGAVIGKAMTANLTWTRNTNQAYADDALDESDNSITSGQLTYGLNDLTDEARALVLGDEAVGTDTATYYEENGASAPDVGFGYIKVHMRAGVLVYIAHWIHKVKFAVNSESTNTKGQNIEWQHPEIVGDIAGVTIDNTGKLRWRKHKEFSSYAAALAWLKGFANITGTSGGGGTT